MSINDQIAELGSQLEAAILNAYTAVPTGGLASLSGQAMLAFLPGDIAAPAATFLEPVSADPPQGGLSSSTSQGTRSPTQGDTEAVNPLLVTMWLKSDAVGADTPMLLQSDQTTVIGGPPSFTTMSELYFDLVDFAQPLAPPGSPAAEQMAQLLTWAREALPSSPDLLPLATQPSDWPLPNTTYWNQFSYASMPTAPPSGPSASGSQPPPPPNPTFWRQPRIWQLRLMPAPAIATSPSPAPQPASSLQPAPRRFLPEDSVASDRPLVADPSASRMDMAADAAITTMAPAVASTFAATEPNIPTGATSSASPSPAADPAATSSRPTPIHAVEPGFLAGLKATAPSSSEAGTAAPPAPAPATQITLEHMLVSIDRSSWWHNDWLIDSGWYVAGTPRGSSIASSQAPNQVWALPIGLILVQNLTIMGSWTEADATQLTTEGMMLGPFNLGGSNATTNANNGLTITVPGPSVVALFCQPLPVLPPADPPPTAPPSSGATPNSVSGDPTSLPPSQNATTSAPTTDTGATLSTGTASGQSSGTTASTPAAP